MDGDHVKFRALGSLLVDGFDFVIACNNFDCNFRLQINTNHLK